MSSASPSNSMNPFALDEDENPSFPSSREAETPDEGQHRSGLTSGSEVYPDGLPSRGTHYDSIFRDQSAEGGRDDGDEEQYTSHYDDAGAPHGSHSSATSVEERLLSSHGKSNDQMPPDSEIPSIDPESSVPTANQSMYMSYRPSSNGTSQRLRESADSVSRSDGKGDVDLGSSSTPRPYDVAQRKRKQRPVDTAVRRWKGKGKDIGDDTHAASTNSGNPPPTDPTDRARGRPTESSLLDPSFRDNSASPPPDLLRSRSQSASSIGISTNHRGSRSGGRPRDAAAEKHNLLPLPVTAPRPGRNEHELGNSSMTGSARDVVFDAEEEDQRDKPRQFRKSKSERHRHHKRHHRRKHSPALDRAEDGRVSDQGSYPEEEFDDDPQVMLMSTRSNRTESRAGKRKKTKRVDPTANLSERERALWLWANVVDLDGYLQEIYEYYTGKGVYCIALRRVLNLLTSAFVIIFSTFLLSCIDISKFPRDGHGQLKDVIVHQCSSRWSLPHKVFTWIITLFFIWRMVTFAFGFGRLLEIKRFYEHLLDIPNSDIQTIAWGEVVRRIGDIRQENALTSVRNQSEGSLTGMNEVPKLDAHDVANRIMRQENYLIALFTRDLLDLRVRLPIPLSLQRYIPKRMIAYDAVSERPYLTFGENSLTKALEWNLRYCLLGFLFDERGRVRKEFVKERGRQGMIESLQHRFIFMGILNAIFAPFIVLYLLMYSFFRYFEEYHKNPSAIGSRGYTPFARWKFREFNELPHVFERRLDESYPAAKQYVDQFPKEITAISMRFVAFISGAFAAVLVLLSVIDPVFLHFEITPDRSVLFYLGVFTSILAVSRGMVPATNQVFDPELLLTEVVGYVHYMPDTWEGRLHSHHVHAEFSKMFQMKLAIFVQEILSVILTPFILLFSLPACASKIIDFCREFTVHVNGIGYVCSFAVFDFRREGNVKVDGAGAAGPFAGSRLMAQENKMEQSFLHFKITNPEWQPSDPAASMLLSRIADGDTKTSHTLDSPFRLRNGVLRSTHIASSRPSRSRPDVPFVGSEEERLKQKSMLYETALQRSLMFKGANVTSKSAYSGRSSRLQPMEERPEVEDEDGWETARLGAAQHDQELQGSVEADSGAGMLGLIHQVIKN